VTREEIEQKMDELAREYHDTHDRKSQKRFMNWLGDFGRWTIEGAGAFGHAKGTARQKGKAMKLRLSMVANELGEPQTTKTLRQSKSASTEFLKRADFRRRV